MKNKDKKKEQTIEASSTETSKFNPPALQTHYYDILIEPIITEKTMHLFGEENKITFKVSRNVSKDVIKTAFEAVFGVEVVKVRTVNVRAKAKKVGRYVGKTSRYKKAVITLLPGHSISLFQTSSVLGNQR
jgi:large subunit ribosomal protein L23